MYDSLGMQVQGEGALIATKESSKAALSIVYKCKKLAYSEYKILGARLMMSSLCYQREQQGCNSHDLVKNGNCPPRKMIKLPFHKIGSTLSPSVLVLLHFIYLSPVLCSRFGHLSSPPEPNVTCLHQI
jgi:hypothetical protein